MKKAMTLVLGLLLVLTLSGCGEDPFAVPKDGYHLIETDTLTLIHNNGVEETEIFTYTFNHTFIMYTKDEQDINEVHYDFSNNNNYKDISDEFKTFLDSFELIKTDEKLAEFSSKVDFSTGATEGDFNYKTIELTGETLEVYANITTENGVLLRITYTIFDTEEGMLYIPSYIVIETVDLLESTHYDFLNEPNDYDEIDVAVVNHQSFIVALPPRTAYESEYEKLKETDLADNNYFERIYKHELGWYGEYDACENIDDTDCVPVEQYTLQAQVYDSTVEEVQDFYINNFRGNFDSTSFYFISDNQAFRITSFEEATVTGSDGAPVVVVNMTIEFY